MIKLSFVFGILQFNTNCQDLKNQELKVFFSYAIDSIVRKEVAVNSTLIISDRTSNITKLNDDCMKSFNLVDSFRQSDIDSLNEKANSTSSLVLTNDNIKESNFILSSVSRKTSSWNETICTLSNPIFLQDYNYCLFAYDILRGGGETILFKKKNSKWTIYKKICAWYY